MLIYRVSNNGLSLPVYVLDYINKLAKLYPQYMFYFRFNSDRIYMVIENIDSQPYLLNELTNVTKENLDFIIKKDSSFITNTISLFDKNRG